MDRRCRRISARHLDYECSISWCIVDTIQREWHVSLLALKYRVQSVIVSKYSISVDTRNGRNTLRRNERFYEAFVMDAGNALRIYDIFELLKILYNVLRVILVSRIFFPLENFRKSFYIYILTELLSFRFVSRESRQIEDPG